MAANLDLPANLDEFRTAPGFRDVTKHDYEIPSDGRIQATLEDLEATKASHPARYVACWLAIGFGLRRSEAACVRRDWFRQIDGRWHIEIRAVADALDATTERPVTKNGQVRPLIPCANGAWERLAPFIQDATQPIDSYLIAGTGTYRREHLFREISLWLRRHGWQTQKAYHELRAWAGCQVGMAFGFDVASQWLRHGSIVTTQQFYGRYLNTLRKVDDRPAVTFPATVSPAVSQTAQSA
jgi:integrase